MNQPTFTSTVIRYQNGDLRGVEVRAVHVGSDSQEEAQQLRSLNILHGVLRTALTDATLDERARLGLRRITRDGLATRTRGLLHVLNAVNNAGRVGVWQQQQLIRLSEITTEFLLEIIEDIANSNDVIKVSGARLQLTPPPRSGDRSGVDLLLRRSHLH